MWFSQGLFGVANAQIPMVNIWDDHDIIDGFGSYPHHFNRCAVFTGLGAVAFKYYLLFQHQSIVDEKEEHEPSWLLGATPGPYITELSRSCFMSLGRKVAFLGLDCRTERMVRILSNLFFVTPWLTLFFGFREILFYLRKVMIGFLIGFKRKLSEEKLNI